MINLYNKQILLNKIEKTTMSKGVPYNVIDTSTLKFGLVGIVNLQQAIELKELGYPQLKEDYVYCPEIGYSESVVRLQNMNNLTTYSGVYRQFAKEFLEAKGLINSKLYKEIVA